MCEIGYCCTLMKTRTATIDSLFCVFPSEIWCKITKLLKYYGYQVTKRCLEGRLEGLKISSRFLKIMELVEYRIAKKFQEFPHYCRSLHHRPYSRSCHVRFHLMKQSITLTTWFWSVKSFCFLKEKTLNSRH